MQPHLRLRFPSTAPSSWATQGFDARNPGTETFMWTYLGLRTNYPPLYGVPLPHTQARDAATDDVGMRGRLDNQAGVLQGIVTRFMTGASPHRERDAQRAMMELMLQGSGFTVLPPGTPSRWFIGIHERQTNISWEHWWIQTRLGGVVETFPYRDRAVLNATGGRARGGRRARPRRPPGRPGHLVG